MAIRICLLVLAFGALASAQPAPKEAVVNRDQVALLASCGATGNPLATLAAGQRVRFRFALSGSASGCYSVSADVDGREVRGYVPKDAVAGLEEFEQQRRDASHHQLVDSAISVIGLEPATPASSIRSGDLSLDAQSRLLEAAALLESGDAAKAEQIIAQAGLPADNGTAAMLRAKALMRLTRPRQAFEAIEPALQAHRDDPDLLAMAGLSRLQLDDAPAAEAYLRQSLALRPNPSLENVLRRIQRESAADASDQKTYGTRFALRYEDGQLDSRSARELTEVLDHEVTRISQELGCNSNDRLPVIIQSRENYQATTGAADWSAGRYDGRIRIALAPGGAIDAETKRTFSHEYVHACLASLGNWPAWLHEGMAQKLSGAAPHPRAMQLVKQLGADGNLPKLKQLSGGWSGLDSRQAAVAYTVALLAVQALYERYQSYGVRTLLAQPSELARVSSEVDERIQSDFR